MIHVIIRTCPRDDYLALLCYNSFLLCNITANYSFIADTGIYHEITKTNIPIHYKPQTLNYGGATGVCGLLNALKVYDFEDNDIVIISDSDIVVLENFIDLIGDADHCGYGGVNEFKINHISGQMLIFRGEIIKRLVNMSDDERYSIIFDEMNKNKINIADDIYNSYVTDKWKCNKKFLPKNKWLHEKFYNYHRNYNYPQIIDNIKRKYIP
jgi:hypothetical protein